MFDPKPTRYPFPQYTNLHYLVVKKDNGAVFDQNYPYINRSRSFCFLQFWVRVLLKLVVFPVATIRLGLRIHGRKNLKRHKSVLQNGVVSCCNHVHLWDYIAVMKAV